jgi:glutaminase
MELELEVEATSQVREPSPVEGYLGAIHARLADCEEGSLATYIPELAQADPGWFGLALATVDGATYESGDSGQTFTIQSISKPLAYGLALAEWGSKAVHARVGVEPTGDAFNSISLAPESGTPLNPMVNAGAIATTGMIVRRFGAERARERILDAVSRFAGRQLSVDPEVHRSERETGFRNVAIANLLRNFGVLDDRPDVVADVYFEQCSILVSCRDLAVIAATLAGGGVNPLTGERVLAPPHVASVLSVMTSCGMYDSAGEWLFSVGLPAKSGVSGGILAVLPGRLGIAAFSPLLDASGNSVRGVAAFRELSQELGLHLVAPRGKIVPPIRVSYLVGEVSSKRHRTEAERDALAAAGGRTRVYELQGELDFTAAEQLARDLERRVEPPKRVLVDLARVARVDDSALPILAETCRALTAADGSLDLAGVDAGALPRLAAALAAAGRAPEIFSDLDAALEWHEDLILAEEDAATTGPVVALRSNELLRELADEDISRLAAVAAHHRFAAGDVLAQRGEDATAILLVTAGRLSVTAQRADGSPRRLATVVAGMMLGELSLTGPRLRTADVVAETDGACYFLPFAELDRLTAEDPRLKALVLEGVLRSVTTLARRLDAELAIARG